MSKLTKTIKIDDVEYEITQIGGVEGLDLFDRLTRELGNALVDGVRQALSSGKTTDAVLEAAVGAVMLRGFVSLPGDFKRELWTKFAQLTTIKAANLQLPLCPAGGQLQVGDTFDQHFAGRFPHMVKWLLAAMRWGFAGFLPSSGGSGAPHATPTASP